MKRPLWMLFLAALCAGALAACAPARAQMSPYAASKNQAAKWIGTWNCVSGKQHYTTVFTSILGGTAMDVSDTGVNKAEGIAYYDSLKKSWFYTAVLGNGAYFSMMGPQQGKNLNFTSVFASGGAKLTLNVNRVSASKYTDILTMMQGGKTTKTPETCTK